MYYRSFLCQYHASVMVEGYINWAIFFTIQLGKCESH
uniref:Uncharacterized protein n=1 Tax=Rhizophora mucronata TaxID=61149 RepID=A0A2P2JKC1_RHIMU